jgi:hypothetical protein
MPAKLATQNGAVCFMLIVISSCRDTHRRKRGDGLGLSGAIPSRPTARMKPGMAGGFDPERQQRVVALLGLVAPQAAVGRRAHPVAVQPLGNAAREGAGFGLLARRPAVELGSSSKKARQSTPDQPSRALVKKREPSDR